MRHEPYLKASFILILCAWTIIRMYFKVQAGLLHERIFPRTEKVSFIVLRAVLGIPLPVFIFVHIFLPGHASWSEVHLHPLMRWSGVLAAVLAFISLVWVHRALGRNFHTSVVIKKDHQLIKKGPYHLVRHPMYSTYIVLFISLFLVSGNLVIGISGLAIILILMMARLHLEEALLIDRFQEEYLDYIAATARFFPRLRPKAKTQRRSCVVAPIEEDDLLIREARRKP